MWTDLKTLYLLGYYRSNLLIQQINMAQAGRVLIYGGRGALGAKCVSHFKANNYVSKSCFFSIFF